MKQSLVNQEIKGIIIVPNFLFIDNSYTLLLFSPFFLSVKLSPKGKGLISKENIRKYTSSSTSSQLGHYLAGLLEGDGCFVTPKIIKGPDGKARVASIDVIFALKDQPSAELFKNKFGGNIFNSGKKNCVRWMTRDIESVLKIINAINGKLRTPKIKAFYDMIDFINLKYEGKRAIIEKLPLDTSPLSSNAWLSGFIDADGHFSIKGFNSNPRTYLGIQFYLIQRAYDKSGISMELIMGTIAEFLMTKLSKRTIREKYNQFVVNTSGRVSNKILIEYLNKFPLLSSKQLDFQNWEEAFYIYDAKLYKDPIQFEKMSELKNSMNNSRTVFNWDHHTGCCAEIYHLTSK